MMLRSIRGLGLDVPDTPVSTTYGPTDQQLGVSPEQQAIMATGANLQQSLDAISAQIAGQPAPSSSSNTMLIVIAAGVGLLVLMGAFKR